MSNQNSSRKQSLSTETIDRLKRDMLFGAPSAPPKRSTRFQKGQSGNPNGRPRKQPSARYDAAEMRDLTLAEAKRPIRVRQGDKVSEMPVREALIQAQTTAALQGNAYAQRDAIARLERSEREEAAEIARDREYWTARRDENARILAEAKARGEPEPGIFPHPLDIVIEPGKRVRIVGPINEEEARQYEEVVELRDALILQSAVNKRCCLAGDEAEGKMRADGSDVFARMLDLILPKRMKLDDVDWICRSMRFESIPKRALLKAAFASWRAAGCQAPRGALFPDPTFAAKMIKALRKARRMPGLN